MAKTKKELENQVLRLLDLPPDVVVEKSEIKAGTEVLPCICSFHRPVKNILLAGLFAMP